MTFPKVKYSKRHANTTRLKKRLKRAARRCRTNGYLTVNKGTQNEDRVIFVPDGFYYIDARNACSQVIDISTKPAEIWHFQTSIKNAKPHTMSLR